ncbi:acyl-CoA thioesterase domain-containing protein [Sediminicoccus sp. BL-A-41-H5]|uniref:acyl-CoA thioesterase domain-containing protein n=1 Tax=Sediminicoccus sp. BL-A-41-H5 TaxID=3421106 RepID=UPI003D66A3D9
MSTVPIFEALEPGIWRATPLARGPFAGVHGGSVAGLMAAAIEASAGAASGARALSFRADFLRPTPIGVPLLVTVTPVQAGRRLSLLDATVTAEGRLTARCSMTLATEMEVTALAEDFCTETPPPAPDPESLPLRPGTAAHGGPWIMDVLQGRRAPDGAVWFRWSVPLLPGGVSPFVAALGPADFAHGLARPGQPGPSPVPAFPNADLSVQFDRAPRGDWIGVRPFTRWRRQGLGIGYGDLLDLDGAFGRVGMGVVLVPA